MASGVLDNLGLLHVVTGRVVYTSGVPALVNCNDVTLSIADTGSGNFTMTFAHPFRTAPQVLFQYLKATNSAVIVHHVTAEQATTTVIEGRVHSIEDSGSGTTDIAAADPADTDAIMFMVVGIRER